MGIKKYERTLGCFGLSIGTNLAMEALVVNDSENDIPYYDGKIKLLAINVATIARNIIGALDTKNKQKLLKTYSFKDFTLVLEKELEVIREILSERCEVVYYVTDFKEMTKIGGFLGTGQSAAIKQIVRLVSNGYDKLTNIRAKNLMIYTHIIYDAIDRRVNRVLQSHTGVVLDPSNFNKKLNIKDDRKEMLPLTKITLDIFGDGSHVKGVPVKLKREVLEVLVKNRVNPKRTDSWVKTVLKTTNVY